MENMVGLFFINAFDEFVIDSFTKQIIVLWQISLV